MASVSFKNLKKNYGSTEVVKSVNLDIEHGEFVVLLGPSGCGKSTTLRMLAGLEDITDGDIEIGGEVVNDLHPIERNIAMVFQSYALYPHMTVAENIGFSLENMKVPKSERAKMVEEVAEVLELTPLLERKPKDLSGGQRQRVAMGRAMVRTPEVFLFDEPLSNLDAKLRGQMRKEIKALHNRVKTTVIYVTHDQVEAMTLADKVVILNNGHIEQIGTPKEIYENPRTKFVAKFIGTPEMNILDTHLGIESEKFISGHEIGLVSAFGLRPQELYLHSEEVDSEFRSSITVELVNKELLGSVIHLDCLYKETKVTAEVPYVDEELGNSIELFFDKRKVHLFDENNNVTLQ